ncbi:DUF3396 domain-containing protein [Vitiosangium sp. GDMCC 1.1324]|uniref:DUF3396 domain-containing protein n=1 Tax=Vitiosangium sp. (strain GDMCC 1.1324) TaxID=2138576 RepID=UPI000D353CFA|nr:DUF3396 domain-containing protein [Vitiosangium sp. GDMCC 1.1324]PTL79399.1 hypothetical protein DAT35_34990 [Vitiosangium sp. GDMCC 1.1324]
MSRPYPRIRIRAENGYLLIREGLTLTFYIRRSHQDISQHIARSLETYLRAVGQTALGLYADKEGDWQFLDEVGWSLIRQEFNARRSAYIHLTDASSTETRYKFLYQGRRMDAPFLKSEPGATSAVSFWLPTEYLEEQGPERVRDLALELASRLPFCTGNVGLAFNCDTSLVGVSQEIHKRWFRHPGMDVPDTSWVSLHIGTQVRGPSWLTFLGQPVLGELGGAAGLRAQLHHPETTVQELEGDRAVVILGPIPEAGDTEQGHDLPAYRELARVLEPWLYHEPQLHTSAPMEDVRRWERRFLD